MVKEKKNLIDKKIVQGYFSKKEYMPLVTLLELPLSEIKRIYTNIEEYELIDLINYALDWKTKDYWQALSVEWIESGIPIIESTKNKLEKIPNDKGYSQKLRHKVQKLLNKQ